MNFSTFIRHAAGVRPLRGQLQAPSGYWVSVCMFRDPVGFRLLPSVSLFANSERRA